MDINHLTIDIVREIKGDLLDKINHLEKRISNLETNLNTKTTSDIVKSVNKNKVLVNPKLNLMPQKAGISTMKQERKQHEFQSIERERLKQDTKEVTGITW